MEKYLGKKNKKEKIQKIFFNQLTTIFVTDP